MTKREIWNSLDAGWRRAFRKTMKRWMKHVKEGGYWTGACGGCFLCARKVEGCGCSAVCPVGIEREGGCQDVQAYDKWLSKVAFNDEGKTKRKPLREAKTVLRYLCGFPPKSDKTRQDAEALLARRKQ